MARISGEIVIDRSVEDVFDFVSDECNEPRYNPQMLSVEKLSPGPIGSGTQFRAQMKSGSRTLPMLLEFTTFERPIRLGSHASRRLDGAPAGDSDMVRPQALPGGVISQRH